MSMRVQVNGIVLDMDRKPAFAFFDDSLSIIFDDTSIDIVDDDVTMATAVWFDAGCPLPVRGEQERNGYHHAFDVEQWYQDQRKREEGNP